MDARDPYAEGLPIRVVAEAYRRAMSYRNYSWQLAQQWGNMSANEPTSDYATKADIGRVESDIKVIQTDIKGLLSSSGQLKGMLTAMMWAGGIVGAIVLAAAIKTLFGW